MLTLGPYTISVNFVLVSYRIFARGGLIPLVLILYWSARVSYRIFARAGKDIPCGVLPPRGVWEYAPPGNLDALRFLGAQILWGGGVGGNHPFCMQP